MTEKILAVLANFIIAVISATGYLGIALLMGMVERFGKYVLLSRHDLDRTTHFFLKYGSITVFLARLLPVVRTFIALPAGIARMPLLRFHIYTFLGSWPWCLALAYVGMRLGRSWETDPRFKEIFHRFHLGVEAVLLAAIIWFVWSHWKQRVAAA
jgi:membrane protein DedA with SNARE-associated domain